MQDGIGEIGGGDEETAAEKVRSQFPSAVEGTGFLWNMVRRELLFPREN